MNQKLFLNCCKTSFVCLIVLFVVNTVHAQKKKARVLFIGNSYTYVNDLPKLIADVAASTGDTLEYEMSAEGGATLNAHYVLLPATTAKIRAGGWDYVVLQEQSQVPAMSPPYFYNWVYPFAKQLADLVKLYNPCAETIFYMTWGRKNGDASLCPRPINWHYFCTYLLMDSVLRSRYMLMADSNRASVSPVGPVWRYIRNNYRDIELYWPDESHPSPAGSYAGACSFYTAIFKKSPELITYDFSLSAKDAANIRTAASKVVYDSLDLWRIGKYETIADFSHDANRMQPVNFTNKSINATQYKWDFGDGQTSTAANPVHTYTLPGIYTVRLISTGASCSDTAYEKLNITDGSGAAIIMIRPNPATDWLYITSDLFGRDNCRIQVLNVMGQLVYEQRASAATTQLINVAGLARGIYTVNICTNRKSYHQKIIIQ